MKPINVRLRKTRRIPPMKQSVPLSLYGLVKKTTVFCIPMIRVKPERNSICRGVLDAAYSVSTDIHSLRPANSRQRTTSHRED